VGVRGNRIKNIVDELAGERIDIVRWSDDMQILIPNALQPAEVEEVILCQMLGRAIVLVREDQLSLAIGRRGQNVRLASKLCGWDIEIMTREELEEQLDQTIVGFTEIEGVNDELAERLVGEGFMSYDDLSVIEPEDLMAMGGLTMEQVDTIVSEAEQRAEQAERAAADERRRQREQQREDARQAERGVVDEAAEPTDAEEEVAAEGSTEGADAEPIDETAAASDETALEEKSENEPADESGESVEASGQEGEDPPHQVDVDESG
jgi:N utilization substance protein A